jgi:hypothetical protein
MPAVNTWRPSDRRREPAVLGKPIVDPADWYPQQMQDSAAWAYRMTSKEIDEVLAAVAAVEKRKLELKDVTRDDFPLPTLAAGLRDVRDEIITGRGFALVRGLPVNGRTRFQNALAFWGIGLHVGRPVSQNGKGHLLGHVKDMGHDIADDSSRVYHVGGPIDFHCDRCDILSLLCLHPAKMGGAHRICSSVAVHNEMLRRRPDLVGELTFRFYRSRRGEIPPGETEPWTRQPVFSVKDGYFAARGATGTLMRTQKLPGVPKLTDKQLEAIQLYGKLSEELAIDLDFRQGDISYVFNHVTLHARTDYEDHAEAERKRHLLRLWLDTGAARPLHEDVAREINGVLVPGTVLTTPLEAA